jgi:hypothetical protein
MTATTQSDDQTATLDIDVWRLWVREYGAAGAIELALRHGFAREEILRVNREVLLRASQGATP